MMRRLRYRPDLDGLRAIAVLAVMAYHSAPYLSRFRLRGGFLGVDVFFVLSGYLITSLLLEEQKVNGAIQMRSFYARRALRLVPALVLAFGVGYASVQILGSNLEGYPYGLSVLFAALYVGNWFQPFAGGLGVLGHTWSLAVEEQYYLVWPWVVARGCVNTRRRRRMVVGTASAALIVGVVRWVLYEVGPEQTGFFWTIARADGVLWGSALAMAISEWPAATRHLFRPVAVAVAAGAIVIVVTLMVSTQHPFVFRGGLAIACVATTVVIGHLVTADRSPVARLLALQPLPAIGRISYGLYLFHLPVSLALHGVPAKRTGIISVVAMFAVTFLLAALSYVFLESRALRLKARFTVLESRRVSGVEGGA
ncbi:MAG: acyltransferase [Actinomycetota bacterium]